MNNHIIEMESIKTAIKPSEDHVHTLMRLIHGATAINSARATMKLNVRQRLLIQRLGLEGEQAIAAMGEKLGLSPSTMTGLVDRLEADGYVVRRAHPTDRRAKHLGLTRKGREAFRRETDFYLALLDGTLAALGSEGRKQVLAALDAIAARDGG